MRPVHSASRNGRYSLTLTAIALLALGTACAEGDLPAPGTESAATEGRLVIIGGGLSAQNEAVYRDILDGRLGDGPICVFPTAGASPESSMEGAAGRFDRWGGEGSGHGILISTDNPESVHDPEVVEEIRSCGGFFFTGGQQSRIVNVFLPDGEPTPAYEAVMERFRAGAVVSGSSAGAAIMTSPMIAGGNSGPAFEEGLDGGVRLTPGLGFMPAAVMDQHFLARGRIGRLIVAVLQSPDFNLGFGIDENTALVVEGERAWVTGASGVIVVDGSQATTAGTTPAASSGLRLELLGAGDTLDLRTRQVLLPDGKAPVSGLAFVAEEDGEEPASPDAPADGLFERWTLLHLLHHMAHEGSATIVSEVEGHRVIFRAAQGARGVSFAEVGVQGTPYGLSVGPIEIEVEATDPPGAP
jgi:cyanophycinase